MNPLLFVLGTILFAGFVFALIGTIVQGLRVKKLKTNWAADTRKWEDHNRQQLVAIDALKSGNDGLKKIAEEMEAKLGEAAKANEEFKLKETEDAKREEENAKAFEDVQALLKEAEETNEVLLKCISGEITMLEATAQLGEIRKTSVVQEEPVEENMEARG